MSLAPDPARQAERLTLDLDLTIYHAEAQKEQLLAAIARSPLLELDLSQVTAIDSAGVQLLMLAKREAQALDQTLSLIGHSPAVQELFNFFNLAGYFGDPLLIPARPSH